MTIQTLLFKDTDLPTSIGGDFYTNQWKTSIGSERDFILYKKDGSFISCTGIRSENPSDYEGKDSWIITEIHNTGITEDTLSQYSHKMEYFQKFF